MAQHGITVPADSLASLTTRTEGWAAGLRLAAISMGTHPEPDHFVKELITEDSALTGYLMEEVLSTQPPQVRDFLLSTSILTASDHFSWLRTRLSVERTMMSWVRTATALIGFGFTIVQFFARIQETPGVAPAYFPHAPRYLGLSLIFCGVMALVISIWEYQWGLRYLWGGDFAVIAGTTREGKQTPLLAVAIILALIGVFAFFSVLLRLI